MLILNHQRRQTQSDRSYSVQLFHSLMVLFPGSFYSYGPGTDDDLMDQGDDGCPLTLDFSTIVFGIPHSQAYVSKVRY